MARRSGQKLLQVWVTDEQYERYRDAVERRVRSVGLEPDRMLAWWARSVLDSAAEESLRSDYPGQNA